MRNAFNSSRGHADREFKMKALNMIAIVDQNLLLLDDRQVLFIKSIRKSVRLRIVLTNSQHQYLLGIYDEVIARKYGLEPMTKTKLWGPRRGK